MINNIILKSNIIGFIIGALWFFIYENAKPGKSFLDKCWIRKEPQFLAHNKVYFLGMILIYRAYIHKDIYLSLVGSAWIGLHLFQNIGEQINIKKFSISN